MMFYLSCDNLRVQRSAGFVDIAAVGAGMRDDDMAAKVSEELRSNRGGRPVGTIDDNAATIERQARDSGKQEADVLGAVGFVDRRWDGLLRRRRQTGELTEYLLFDREFDSIGQLIAVRAEQFDPIVIPGIVRGRDDNASGKPVRMRKKGDGRSRNHASALYRGPACSETRSQRGSNPLAGLAGVHTEQNAGGR